MYKYISYAYEKGVLKAINKYFANQERNGVGLENGTRQVLYDVGETKAGAAFKDPSTRFVAGLNFVEGLKKCAKNVSKRNPNS